MIGTANLDRRRRRKAGTEIDDEMRALWQQVLPVLRVIEQDEELRPLWLKVLPELKRHLGEEAVLDGRQVHARPKMVSAGRERERRSA